MNRFLLLFLLGLVFEMISGCSKDSDLNDSIWLPDPKDPELPQYSEWGYNTFGAFVDRVPFTSDRYNGETPIKVIRTNQQISFRFLGNTDSNNLPFNSIILTMEQGGIVDLFDLIVLNDSLVDLLDPRISVGVEDYSGFYPIEVIKGEFNFKRTQKLIIDEEPIEVILSGVFAFQALINGNPVTISEGRFDFGVNEYNFFSY